MSAHVTFVCDQDAETVNLAGLRAFEKATELVNDAWAMLTEGT